MKTSLRILLATTLVAICGTERAQTQTLFGPTPYLQQSDSPFFDDILTCDVLVETFEDGQFNVPDVMASAGAPFGPAPNADSVDIDDGIIDGSGSMGRSFFFSSGNTGITFTFSDPLPTKAGIVWTDGAGTVTFQAFDENGVSLGEFPTHTAGAGNSGQTDEDRFYGAENGDGISSIFICNSSGGIEVDHLQYSVASFVTGDVNGDDAVTLLDVVPFVNVLTSGDYQA